jgi:uncharacterized protein (DUF736 family)
MIDDPIFVEPLRGALFEDGEKLNFIWRRKPRASSVQLESELGSQIS